MAHHSLEVYARTPLQNLQRYAGRPVVEEPTGWQNVVSLVPRLSPTHPNVEIMVAYNGELYPIDHSRARRHHQHLAKVCFEEWLGLSRAFKTRSMRHIARLSTDYPFEVIRERPPGLIALYNPPEYNYTLSLGAAMHLTDRINAYRNGGRYIRTPNFVGFDRGLVSAMLFNAVYKKFDMGDPIPDMLAKKHFQRLDLIMHLDITPETSKERGSMLSDQMRGELDLVHKRLPDFVAEMSKGTYKPVVLARINASGSLKEVQDLTARTHGSIIKHLIEN